VLRSAGYHTSISGKWHLGRRQDHSPAARGFDRSWVLLDGWAEHYYPGLETRTPRYFREDGQLVEYPYGKYSSEWFTEKAIEFVDEARAKEQPFFVVAAYSAPHWPLQAPPEMIERQKGKYDSGYDELRQRRTDALVQRAIIPAGAAAKAAPPILPVLHHDPPFLSYQPWTDLSAMEKKYSARLMEIYAAMVESLDSEIGRLFNHLKETGQFDNTLICFLSDNGAASEYSSVGFGNNRLENAGLPLSFVAYGPNWARASSGPFRLLKGHAAEGGIRAPCIIKLPNTSHQRWSAEFTTVLDIAPTIYDLAGAEYPAAYRGRPILPLQGTSLLPHLHDRNRPVHSATYGMGWELFGRAAYRRSRWKITWVEPPSGPGEFELFDILHDPGETVNLRASQPELFGELTKAWHDYARHNGVVVSRPAAWQSADGTQ
jgi:arylsulfatase